MEFHKYIKESFVVIGKEGCTNDGDGFVGRLWEDANNHYSEIAGLVRKNNAGQPAGFWGAMIDFSREFNPWEEDFSKGIYLAGAVQDYICPQTGKSYIYLPIRRL